MRPTGFVTVFVVFAILGILQIPVALFFRRQAQLNPARQTAFSEPVVFQAHITARTRWPTRVWRPNHWYFARSSMVDIFVRTSTVQVSSSLLRRQGRRYGRFLTSSQTTMWLSSMRPYPMSGGQQQCIILSGFFPFRGQNREIQLAVFSREQTREIWEALARSGVRDVAAPDGDQASLPALQTVVAGPSWGAIAAPPGPPPPPPTPPSFPSTSQSYGPPAEPPYAPEFAPPAKRRVWLFVAAGLFVCSPLLLGFIISHVSRHQSDLSVVTTGPSTLATLSNLSCVSNGGGQVAVSGTITAATNLPQGLTVHWTIEDPSGTPVGPGAYQPESSLNQGESEAFQGVSNDSGAANPDRCIITWAASSLSS